MYVLLLPNTVCLQHCRENIHVVPMRMLCCYSIKWPAGRHQQLKGLWQSEVMALSTYAFH